MGKPNRKELRKFKRFKEKLEKFKKRHPKKYADGLVRVRAIIENVALNIKYENNPHFE